MLCLTPGRMPQILSISIKILKSEKRIPQISAMLSERPVGRETGSQQSHAATAAGSPRQFSAAARGTNFPQFSIRAPPGKFHRIYSNISLAGSRTHDGSVETLT
ncbi:unnamed protein product [Nesidiocoris tenuis]|nr:unnamed protein product [Nesidiocoris tenuis]